MPHPVAHMMCMMHSCLLVACRSLQSRLLNQLPTQVFDTIVLNALPATPCLVECIQIHAAKLERWA